jgi:FkbM family methyltransferase
MGTAIGTVMHHRIRNHDLTFDTSDPVVTPKVEAELFWRLYEGAEIRFARKHLAGASSLVDLGSSLGFAASHALSRMSPAGSLVAVEANATLLGPLRRTLDDHAGNRKVTVLHGAIGYDGPEVRFAATPGGTTTGRIVTRQDDVGVDVPALTLSGILDRQNVDRFALMADIEGAERDIIERDAAALSRCDRMVIELHETPNATVMDLWRRLIELGFRVLESRGPVLALTR